MYSLYIKFQEKIFTGKKIIQLWNFGNFGIPEIIPKILVTLRFSKISLHELKGNCKCFKMRYWPHFYVDPTHSNTYFSKVGIWRVLLQGTVIEASAIYGIYNKPCMYTVSAWLEPHSWIQPHPLDILIEPQSKTKVGKIQPQLE